MSNKFKLKSGFQSSESSDITGSLTVSGSVVDFTNTIAISGSTFSGSFVGDGSGLSGISGGGGGSGIFVATGSIHSTTNDLRITGSVFIDDTSTSAGTGDANAVFKVRGTEGNLITVTNNLTNLLDVKDVSGVSVFQVSGSGEVIMKDLPTTQPTTTGSLWISGSGTPPGAAGSGYLMIFVG
jgi:hypothetical protein